MTASAAVGDWVVVLHRQDPEGQKWELASYGYATEQEASAALGPLLLRHRERGYLRGSVRQRLEEEAGVGVRR